jgi:hypothetical protein
VTLLRTIVLETVNIVAFYPLLRITDMVLQVALKQMLPVAT